ncbi:MAG: IS1182 family transposase [Peptostreptococcales bacterium]
MLEFSEVDAIMLRKNSEQIDVFNHMIFERLIPKDHLLVKIDSTVDFSFVYDKIKDKYSKIGRGSKDPTMMLKILLLEYLYRLSDVEVAKRIKTDIAFRWFLKLSIDDPVPDDTTISHFRIKRLGEEDFEDFFNEIVKQCIKKDLIKTNRYLIDSTDVDANVNYPSDKKLIRNAYRNVIKQIDRFDENLSKEYLEKFESEIDEEYKNNEKVSAKKHYEIVEKNLSDLYIKTYDELQNNSKYEDAYGICYDIIDKFKNDKGDRIVSVVDPDARIAHKSPGKIKKGYKNHIIIDEDSEIILASEQTPFNVNDHKKFKDLIKKVDTNLELKPKEISADKAYGTLDNRAFLKDNEITSNIAFYRESSKEKTSFGLDAFEIAEDVSYVICPNGIKSTTYKDTQENGKEYRRFKIDPKICDECILKEQCFSKTKAGKIKVRSKFLMVPKRYDVIKMDLNRVETDDFKKAYNKRYKIERRFATMVLNHGLRRCRYVRLHRAKIHIILANTVCNIIRMVNLTFHPKPATS